MRRTSSTLDKRHRASAKQASMADVARYAGVSMITVSRMLREPERVSSVTRQKIEEAIKEVGYVPNLVAGGLASTQTRIVAAVLPYFQYGGFELVHGLSDHLTQNGFCLMLGNSDGRSTEEDEIARIMLGHRPAALVIQGASHTGDAANLLRKANIPIVEMDSLPAKPIDMCVGYSNKKAAKTAVAHLIARGRRRIGMITANPKDDTRRSLPLGGYLDRHALRLQGYKEALKEAKIALDPEIIVPANFSIADGRKAFSELLARSPDLDAVFCAHDIWAMGTVLECQRRNIEIPAKLSICGFGDLEVAAEMIPSITTIRVPRYEIGAMAADLIIARLQGASVKSSMIDVGFKLVERSSS